MRTKEYLVLVRVRDDRLALTTMRFHDEIRPADDIDTGGRRPAKAQLTAATQLIEALSADWDPERYRDCYRERLLAVIEQKRKGGKITAPPSERKAAEAPPDIMAALKASLDRVRAGEDGGNGGAGGDTGGEDGEGDLQELSRDELYERAQDADVPGRSSMTKDELVRALSE
jgi:DNA end-binding protein Ku